MPRRCSVSPLGKCGSRRMIVDTWMLRPNQRLHSALTCQLEGHDNSGRCCRARTPYWAQRSMPTQRGMATRRSVAACLGVNRLACGLQPSGWEIAFQHGEAS